MRVSWHDMNDPCPSGRFVLLEVWADLRLRTYRSDEGWRSKKGVVLPRLTKVGKLACKAD